MDIEGFPLDSLDVSRVIEAEKETGSPVKDCLWKVRAKRNYFTVIFLVLPLRKRMM